MSAPLSVSEAVSIIRFLESKGLLCKECGREATFFTGWEGAEGGHCKDHVPSWNKGYREQRTTNGLYRSLLTRLHEWAGEALSEIGGGIGRSDPPLDPGGAPASELRPSNMGEELSANTQEVDTSASGGYRARGKASRDPLGADVDCYVSER